MPNGKLGIGIFMRMGAQLAHAGSALSISPSASEPMSKRYDAHTVMKDAEKMIRNPRTNCLIIGRSERRRVFQMRHIASDKKIGLNIAPENFAPIAKPNA